MNFPFVLYAIGKLLQLLSQALLVPAAIAFIEIGNFSFASVTDSRVSGFIIAMVSSALLGIGLMYRFRSCRNDQITPREGFAIVTFGWIALTFLSSVPLWLYLLSIHSHITAAVVANSFTNAYFEIMSGFTTTGASVFTDIEALPQGMLFWRSMTHWLGGMGIVTLALAVFPAFGVSAYQLFRGEIPGPSKERLRPRLAQTAMVLWGVYASFTVLEALLLKAGGMSLFDSFCHAFGTMATGGFSTRNQSIAAYESDYIHWVIAIFMVIAGTNFVLFYRAIFARDPGVFRRDREFKFYITIMLVAIIAVTAVLTLRGTASEAEISRHFRADSLSSQQVSLRIVQEQDRIGSLYKAFRNASFHVISIMTTTGFVAADFDAWPNSTRAILLVLMFFGGCAGSTAGGIKMIRIVVILKAALREVRLMLQPRLIYPLKIDKQAIEERQVSNITSFFVLYMVIFAFMSLLVSLIIPDFTTAISSVVATLCNIGPGFSGVGALENYGWIPLPGKWILIACMLLGRLEIYTVLVVFSPYSWRR